MAVDEQVNSTCSRSTSGITERICNVQEYGLKRCEPLDVHM